MFSFPSGSNSTPWSVAIPLSDSLISAYMFVHIDVSSCFPDTVTISVSTRAGFACPEFYQGHSKWSRHWINPCWQWMNEWLNHHSAACWNKSLLLLQLNPAPRAPPFLRNVLWTLRGCLWTLRGCPGSIKHHTLTVWNPLFSEICWAISQVQMISLSLRATLAFS